MEGQQQMDMFSLAEMEMLYEKAMRHFATGKMVPIRFIYRDKSPEYFQQFATAAHNGRDQIMLSHEKNGTGHPQCPIVVGKLKGMYFATFVHESGFLPASSYFGNRRISVSTDYFLQPKRYSLYFTDFYCAKRAGDIHYIMLVLAERGSNQERFCQAHLIQLDMQDNPFLYFDKEREQYFVIKNETDHIYLFHAADFNISKCKTAGKCSLSWVKIKRDGISDRNKAFGQLYDDRCDICAIRGKNDGNNNNHALVARLDSLLLGISSSGNSRANANRKGGWRLWNFDCPDFDCSQEQWAASLSSTEHFFPDSVVDVARHGLPLTLLSLLKLKLPSKMAKEIYNRRMLGTALFREGIVPDSDHPSRHTGGYFGMYLFTTMGDHNMLDKFDQLFNSLISLALHELPMHLKSEMSGIFLRANIPHGKTVEQYENPGDLPCKFAFELWIQDKGRKGGFLPELKKWSAEQQAWHGMALDKWGFKK